MAKSYRVSRRSSRKVSARRSSKKVSARRNSRKVYKGSGSTRKVHKGSENKGKSRIKRIFSRIRRRFGKGKEKGKGENGTSNFLEYNPQKEGIGGISGVPTGTGIFKRKINQVGNPVPQSFFKIPSDSNNFGKERTINAIPSPVNGRSISEKVSKYKKPIKKNKKEFEEYIKKKIAEAEAEAKKIPEAEAKKIPEAEAEAEAQKIMQDIVTINNPVLKGIIPDNVLIKNKKSNRNNANLYISKNSVNTKIKEAKNKINTKLREKFQEDTVRELTEKMNKKTISSVAKLQQMLYSGYYDKNEEYKDYFTNNERRELFNEIEKLGLTIVRPEQNLEDLQIENLFDTNNDEVISL